MNITEAHKLLREMMDEHELYHVDAKMNNRLTSAFGRYRYNRLYNTKMIELSSKLVSINDVERVKKTILHEIAHALTEGHGHDRVWRAKLLEIGGDGKRCYDSTDTNTLSVTERAYSTKRYILRCVNCGHEWRRIYRRKMNGYQHPGCGRIESVEM